MKYKIGQMIVRNDTGQKFTIIKDMGLCRKFNSFGFERMYELKRSSSIFGFNCFQKRIKRVVYGCEVNKDLTEE